MKKYKKKKKKKEDKEQNENKDNDDMRIKLYSKMVFYGYLTYYDGKISIPNDELKEKFIKLYNKIENEKFF